MNSRLSKPLPLEHWPECDQSAWSAALNGHPLSPGGGGHGAHWRDSTRLFIQKGYGAWLSWLSSVGALDPGLQPHERASRSQVRAYLDRLEEVGLADYTRAGKLQTLGDALRVMAPGSDVGFIARAAGRIHAGAKRARDLRSKLRPPQEVLEFGFELMRQGEEDSGLSEFERALAYRDGLLISFWVLRAPRLANLASLQLGRELMKVGDAYRVTFEAADMKGNRTFSYAWPAALTPMLERYLEHHRLVLRERNKLHVSDEGLWISQFGRQMAQGSVAQMIKLRTKARFGEALTPHFMRHMDATFIAEELPHDIVTIPAILAHASLETAEKHYILAGSVRAAEAFQEMLVGQVALHARGRRRRGE